jgi:hypothetical protein
MTTAAVSAGQVQKIVLPGQSPDGQYILSVLLKRTYGIVPGGHCRRAAADRKLLPADQFWDDPMNSSVKFESDFVPYKLATDVVLNGFAYAPKGVPAESLLASLEVGDARKDVLVVGDRHARYQDGGTPAFSDPEPFESMELRYERAYGGPDIYSDPKLPCLYPRNPFGRGFVIQNLSKTVEGLPLPNFEDPADRLTPERLCCGHFMHWERQPKPQSFGWFPKSWLPRSSLAGVLPADRAVEQELRAVYTRFVPPHQRELYEQTKLPDMNFSFFNGASAGLVFPFLLGDEKVRTLHLSPEGELTFQLPGDRPRIGLDIGAGPEDPEVVLHTVMIRMEEREVDLVWRAASPYPGPDWLPQMRKMEVLVDE